MAKGWRGVEKVADRLDGREWIFACPKANCFYAVSADSEENALKQEQEHKCPYQGGITHIAGGVTMMLVEEMWAKADKVYAKMEENPSDALKGRLNGMCEMIAIFMRPHFTLPAEIGKELTKRRAMAQAGEPYDTPGLGSRQYEMPRTNVTPLTRVREGDTVRNLRTGQIGKVTLIEDDGGITVEYPNKGGFTAGLSMHELESVKEEQSTSKVTKPGRVFTETERAGIKFAHDSGMFTLAQIAQTYSANERDIKGVLGLA